MEFKAKLKNKRKELKLTQQEVADGISVSRSVVAKWETGLVIPKDDVMISLATFLKVEPSDLATDEIEPLLIAKNKNIRKKSIIIYALIVTIILLISIPIIISNSKYRNIENPIITAMELDDDIPVLENTYYLTAEEEYELYFEVLVADKTYKLNPKFYISTLHFEVIEKPILIEEEKIDSKTLKLKYKALISTIGAFKDDEKIDIFWNYNNDPHSGPMCKFQINNVFSLNSSLLATEQINFYYLNKKICTYNLERGKSISDLLFIDRNKKDIYDCTNEGNLINALLNSEFRDIVSYIQSESDIYCLSELGFDGWIRDDGKSLDELIFEEVNVYATFANPRIDFSKYVKVNDDSRIGLADYTEPGFIINGEHTKNVKYTLYSDSNIVSIVDGKYKLTDYGVAEITVEFDFGFCSGTTTFIVERKETH